MVGDWDLAQNLLRQAPKLVADAMKKAVYQEALFLAGEIKKNLRTGPFKGLSAWTLAGRRASGFKGSKPLNVTGDLKAGITVFPNHPAYECFVGVLKTAQRKPKIQSSGSSSGSSAGGGKGGSKGRSHSAKADGAKKQGGDTSLINVAQVLEEGRTFMVHVTPRMRRYIFGVLMPEMDGSGGGSGSMKKGVIVVHIPARPFIRPVIEQFGATLRGRFQDRLSFLLAGKLTGKDSPAPKKPEPDSKTGSALKPPARGKTASHKK